MSKMISFGKEAKKNIAKGVETLAKGVKVTLGPKGRNVLIEQGENAFRSTKDGQTVAKSIVLKDKFENMGAALLKEAAAKTNRVAGDGTTSAIVLTEAIFKEGLKYVVAGRDPMLIKKGMDEGRKVLITALEKLSSEVKSTEDIIRVATLSANHDREIGEIIASVFEKIGPDGLATVEKGQGKETHVNLVKGMSFDKGYLSPYFVMNGEKMRAEMDNGYVFVTSKKLSSAYDVVPILQLLSEKEDKSPLLIIADEIENEALSTLVLNCLKGGMKLCAVKTPAFGDRRRSWLEDIAIFTGATVISEETGHSLDNLDFSHLGKAKKILIEKEGTAIIEGYGIKEKILARVKEVKNSLSNTTSDYEKEKLQERLAALSGGVATIEVGAFTETELDEKKDRVEDALHATRAAIKEGIIPGGGVAYLRLLESLDSVKLPGDANLGIEILKIALKEPTRAICENAGQIGDVIIARILENRGDFGFNALTENFENLLSTGIIDPTTVAKEVITNAISTAGMLLTLEVLITEKPEKKKPAPSMPMDGMGGMGGMGGMPGMGGMM